MGDTTTGDELPAAVGAQETASVAAAAVHCYARRDGGVHAIRADEAVAELRELRKAADNEPRLWIDVVAPGPAEEMFLRDQLGLHHLAVEDSVRGRQRPKLDRYRDFFFLVVYVAGIERDRVTLEELHMFVGRGWIVTVHDHKLREVNLVIARWRGDEASFPTTASLAYCSLDSIVDSYIRAIDNLGVRVDDLENRILSADRDDSLSQLLELRREVATTRRVLAPLHEIARVLLRRDAAVLDDSLEPYLQDLLDHVKRETDELDAMRDTLGASLQAYYSVSANNLNHTLRIMASWSIILMAMAWIAGVYGMNFEHMPELRWQLGYVWALALMLGVGAGLGLIFKRRGWL